MRRFALAVLPVVLALAMAPALALEALVAAVGYRISAPRLVSQTRTPPLAREAIWLGVGERPHGKTVERFGLGDLFAPFTRSRGTHRRASGHAACSAVARFTPRGKGVRSALHELARTTWLSRNADAEVLKRTLAEETYFGRRAYGFRAAARVWFGRDVSTLSTAEIALLASIIQSPSRYDPIKRPDAARRKRDRLLAQLRVADLISAPEFESSLAEPLAVFPIEDR